MTHISSFDKQGFPGAMGYIGDPGPAGPQVRGYIYKHCTCPP